MKGQRPILLVEDLQAYLAACPPKAKLALVPEEGDGFPIGGVIQLSSENGTPEVWILIDEFGEADQSMEWSGGPLADDDEEPLEESFILELEERDVVQVRGKLRSA
jgi:hypothetical protein